MMSGKPADEADAYEREAENRRRLAQEADEMERREQEQVDRRRREGYPPGPPHHSNAGSIPIHQPVASRAMGAIHSPGGLLANHGSGSSAPPMPLGAPSGPGANFGGPLQPDNSRPPQHGGPNNPNAQHQMFAPIPHTTVPPSNSLGAASGGPPVFGGPLQQRDGQQPMQQGLYGGGGGNSGSGAAGAPGGQGQTQQQGQGGIAHGQQPILNLGHSKWKPVWAGAPIRRRSPKQDAAPHRPA
ncbi:hypothetical protein ColLi_07870 [Colletotrichum liriopes]|uniref:Uncharacterized protein n=1 Tax=Colletotrichum liriopes TaxID=708192 RepID=A0AA37LUL4_9PEZI|nr:hypothetical protein ColLi_07870 [Colletotrichum liriopes]